MLGLVLSLLTTAAGLATPMVTKWVLDSVGSAASLVQPIAVLLGVLVFSSAVRYWQWVLLGSLAERVVLEARRSMIRRLFRVSVGGLAKWPTGELVTRVTSDTLLLREAASSSVIGLVNGTIMLVGTLVMMAVLDLVLLASTLAAVLVIIVLFSTVMPAIAKAQERAQDSIGRLGGLLEGTLRAVRTVKASRAEGRQADRVLADAEESTEHSIRAVRKEATASGISNSGLQFAIILVLGVGGWRVNLGLLETSSLIAFLLYAFQLVDPLTELTHNISTLQSGVVAASRIRELDALEVEESVERRTETGAESTVDLSRPILALRGVTAAYGPGLEPVLSGIDIDIPRYGHTAVVGPSGAGKSTLFALVLRFLEPRSGLILLDGRPYSGYSHDEIRRRLAYVEQETPVVPGTIRDNLLFTHPDASEAEIHRALRRVRLEDVIDALPHGLDTPLSSSSVSGGQRQRIALARAILRPSDVLLLDEATAQVDGLTESAIHDFITRRARHGAVVTIAHRLSTVVDADTILLLENGKVRARGTHVQLLRTDALYAELVKALHIPADFEEGAHRARVGAKLR
ncbi:ABC transporter ATP-binding protein [Allokutzneria albata]|uniref:ATP-binding cassette, subfamily B n=1 Tax=Allokutzneria albata TaxID=211114 RepID=A0A1G9UF48_ALLAB|nr:ABC transporter ATP-binding protein [Allokutzneria albata]SDM58364.1 ATP-binding cassette, subfamily B [Allokutzneria albata]